MMETILSFIATAVCELLDWLVSAFLGAMNLSLPDMVNTFPFLVTGYELFQSIGIGLIVCIAVWNLVKFFGGQISETKDTPVQLLFRALISGACIWFGGYFLELVVELAKIPFDTVVNARAITLNFSGLVEGFDSFAWFGEDVVALAISPGAVLLVSLILMLLIGWNVLKLMVEVCERYLMVAVLVYSSPLIYPTFTSSATAQIFKRWCGMFFGQCALMTLSAWMLKLICSGFSFSAGDHNIMFRMMLTLAMCKIAQRTDTYMQQLGIGVATTGGNLLDEAIGAGMAMARSAKSSSTDRNSSSKSAILGASADGSLSRFGGLFGGVSNMVQKGVRDFKSGVSASTMAENAKKHFLEGTGIGDSLKGWANMDAAQRKEATMKAAAGFATGGVIGNTLNSMKSARSTSLTSQEVVRKAMQSQSRFESRIVADPEKYQPRRGSGRDESLNTSAWTDSVREAQRSAGQGAEQYMRAQRTAYGVGGVEMKEDRLTLDETALKAGTRWDNNGPEARDDRIYDKDDNGIQQTFSPEDAVSWNMAFPDQPVAPGDTITPEQAAQWNETLADPINSLEGPSDVVGDFIGANYSAGSLEDEAHRDFNEAMVNTAREAPLAAEQALMNHYNTLEGNDRLGDALLKSAIGEEAITGQTGGTFSNVRAEAREDGRRIITADYTDSNGKRSGYEIYNNNALVGKEKLLSTSTQIRESLMGKMQTVETKGSGEQISIRRVEATTHNFSSNPPENPSGDPDGPIIIDIPGQGMSSAGGPIPLFSDEEPAGGVPLKEPEFAPTPAPRAESKRGDSAPASLNEAMPMQSNIPIQEVSDHDQLPNTVLPKEGQPGFLPDLHAEHPGVGGQHAVDYVSGDDAGEGLRTNFETSGMNPFVEGRPVSAEHEERGTAYESALPVGGSRDNGLGYTDINGEKRNGENLEPETNQLRNAAFTAPQESVQMGQTKAYMLDNSGDNLNFGEKLQPVQSEPTPGSENSSTHSENPIRHENSDAARESLPGKMKVTLKETEVIHEKESPSEGPQTTESSARSDTRRETEQVGKAASNHSMPELRTESGQRISIRKQMVVTETVDLQKNTQENKPQEFHVPIPKSQRTNGIGTPQGIPGKRHRKK